MKRAELEHVIRAAAAITGRREWVVVGSQAILGAHPDAAAELLVSQEADLYSPEEESASDIVDGTIGELSPFHESFGYYAHGVGPETATLPSGWRSRAVTIETPEAGSAVGICPEPCDLAISKIVAWREKDRIFVATLLRYGMVTLEGLRSRIPELPEAVAEMVASRLEQLTPG